MKCVIPLAGPDFHDPEKGIRPLSSTAGGPLLRHVIESRPWWQDGTLQAQDLILVLRQGPGTNEFRAVAEDWWPGVQSVTLSNLTQGAAMTALAGMPLIQEPDEPVIVDLGDILFSSDHPQPLAAGVDAAAPWFQSNDPGYSYLDLDADGRVRRVAEKRVISTQASVGVYVFRNTECYLTGLLHSMQNRQTETVNGLYFVCPVLNGIIATGGTVSGYEVDNVICYSRQFHTTEDPTS